MSRGVNRAIILGHCGRDPERVADNVAKVGIATTYGRKDKNTGEWANETTWHNVVFFGKLADIACEYLKKGSQCYVEGRISVNKWQDKEGNNRQSTEIIAQELQLLGGRSDKTAPAGPSDGATYDDDIPF